MKIKFKTRRIYQENVLLAASPEAEALFQLLRPKSHIKPNELPLVAKMGFEIEIVGDIRELNHEISESSLVYTKENGGININPS